MALLNSIWGAWQRFGRFMGDLMGRVVLVIFYFTILAPFGLVMRWTQDPLRRTSRGETSFWVPRPSREVSLSESQKGY